MLYFSHFLPDFIKKRLFGDRSKFGLIPIKNDSDWIEWQGRYLDFYLSTQKGKIGQIVSQSGYKVLQDIDLTGKRVLEIGPGIISHYPYWKGKPADYVLVDIQEEMLAASSAVLKNLNISFKKVVATDLTELEKLGNESFDLIVTFNSLEHLYPLSKFLTSYLKLLKTGGEFVGSIPAEGGIAWGLGRFLTTRRWFHKNTTIDPDKIICWEHPNFAPQIISELSKYFTQVKLSFWPLKIAILDINLTVSFIFKKKS